MTTEQFTEKKLKEHAKKQPVQEQAPKDYREAGFGNAAESFAQLVYSRADASKVKKEMEAIEKDLGGQILAHLASAGVDRVAVEQFRVTAYASQSRTISAEKLQESLLSLGVPMKKIVKALEEATQVKPYVALKVTDSTEPRKERK